MFRISCFADEISPDLIEQVRVMKSLGIKYVELRSVENKNVLDLTDDDAKRIKEVFDENGITVSSIGSPLGKVDIDCDFEAYLEKVRRAIALAEFFGTKYIRIFSFYHEGKTLEECRGKVMERLSLMLGVAKKSGIVLCHENEAAIYGEKGNECRDICVTLRDENFRSVLDPANYVLANERPYECLKQTHEFIEYLHIKDAITKTREIVPAGEGDGQVSEILDFLRYHDGMFLTLEPHLAVAGKMRGFSGEELFGTAYRALTGILQKLGIKYE